MNIEPIKKVALDSACSKRFTVAEERYGNVSMYPATRQLPEILKIVDREFKAPLPPRIARVDHRGKIFDKIVLRSSAQLFCDFFNGDRSDELLFFPITDRNFVSHIAVVQKVTEYHPKGPLHYFKFYTGQNFHQEIYFSGRRLYFTQHMVDRFLQRIPQKSGENWFGLLNHLFSNPLHVMECNKGVAFTGFTYRHSMETASVMAFPFHDTGDSFILLTCLSIDEIKSFNCTLPVHMVNPSYEKHHVPSLVRDVSLRLFMGYFFLLWKERAKRPDFTDYNELRKSISWRDQADRIARFEKSKGFNENSRMKFADGICGPIVGCYKSEHDLSEYNELEDYKKVCPGHDWDLILSNVYSPNYRLTPNDMYRINYAPDMDELLEIYDENNS